MYTAGIIIASTKGALGERDDLTGPMLEKYLSENGFEVKDVSIVTDDADQLALKMRKMIDELKIDLVLTSGGTGLSPSDVTPEATRAVLEMDIPGLAEAIRAVGRTKTPHADLSRGLSGARRQSLIVNLPGSPKGAMEGLETVLPAIPHALDKIKGDPADCAE